MTPHPHPSPSRRVHRRTPAARRARRIAAVSAIVLAAGAPLVAHASSNASDTTATFVPPVAPIAPLVPAPDADLATPRQRGLLDDAGAATTAPRTAPPTVDPSLGVLVDTYAWDERSPPRRSAAVAHREHGRRLVRHGDTPRPPHRTRRTRLPDRHRARAATATGPEPRGVGGAARLRVERQLRHHQPVGQVPRRLPVRSLDLELGGLAGTTRRSSAPTPRPRRPPIRTRWPPPSTSSAAPAPGRTAAATSVDRRRLTISPRTRGFWVGIAAYSAVSPTQIAACADGSAVRVAATSPSRRWRLALRCWLTALVCVTAFEERAARIADPVQPAGVVAGAGPGVLVRHRHQCRARARPRLLGRRCRDHRGESDPERGRAISHASTAASGSPMPRSPR